MNKKLITAVFLFFIVLITFFIWVRFSRAYIDSTKVAKISISDSREGNVVITNKEDIDKIVKKINSQKFSLTFSRPKMRSELDVIVSYNDNRNTDAFGYSKMFLWKNGITCKPDISAYKDIVEIYQGY